MRNATFSIIAGSCSGPHYDVKIKTGPLMEKVAHSCAQVFYAANYDDILGNVLVKERKRNRIFLPCILLIECSFNEVRFA